MKTFTIRENQIVLNPCTPNEENITYRAKECSYCVNDKNTCGHAKKCEMYCDFFIMIPEYKEVPNER